VESGRLRLQFFARNHAQSTTLVERGVAAALARQAAAFEAERSHWRREYRRHRWQSEELARAARELDPYTQARAIAAGWRAGNESVAIETLLRTAGIPLDPPREWTIPGEAPP